MENKFSENLKTLRKEKGLSQGELAVAVNVTQRKISYLEKGTVEPNLQDLIVIANYFDVSIDFLVGRNEF